MKPALPDRSRTDQPERAGGRRAGESLTLALASPFSLDRDALPALFERSDAGWRLVACEKSLPDVRAACRRYTPDAALLALNASADEVFAASADLIAKGFVQAVALLDTEFAYYRARRAIQSSQTMYCTRCDDFEVIAKRLRACLQQSAASEQNGRHAASAELRAKEPVLAQLTLREEELLYWLAHGLTVKEISQRLHLAESTVDNRKSRIMGKLGVHRIAHLVHLAHQSGLI